MDGRVYALCPGVGPLSLSYIVCFLLVCCTHTRPTPICIRSAHMFTHTHIHTQDLRTTNPKLYEELMALDDILEHHYRDMQVRAAGLWLVCDVGLDEDPCVLAREIDHRHSPSILNHRPTLHAQLKRTSR